MKRIEVQITDELVQGMFAISLVDEPAIEANWICLRAQKDSVIMLSADSEKQLITGPVLIPDKPIYRVDENGEEYEIVFTTQVIEQLRDKYMKEKRTDQVTEMHMGGTVGVFVVELWTIQNEETDKAAALGMKLPKGTLMATMKVENPQIWERVKSGEYKGYSIEAYLNVEKVLNGLTLTRDEQIEAILEEVAAELLAE